MDKAILHILLADDDLDDCDFFKEALEELERPIELTTLNDGVQLMNYLLSEGSSKPNMIFLDLNMPKKSGMECMLEIKSIDNLEQIPIVIYSTSLDRTVVNNLYEMGAHHYIQKPGEFYNIKAVIEKAVTKFMNNVTHARSRDEFVIHP